MNSSVRMTRTGGAHGRPKSSARRAAIHSREGAASDMPACNPGVFNHTSIMSPVGMAANTRGGFDRPLVARRAKDTASHSNFWFGVQFPVRPHYERNQEFRNLSGNASDQRDANNTSGGLLGNDLTSNQVKQVPSKFFWVPYLMSALRISAARNARRSMSHQLSNRPNSSEWP